MPSDLQITNIRDLNNANSAITIASDGQITVNQNNPTLTLGSNAVMPSHSVVHAQTTELAGSSTELYNFSSSGSFVYGTYYTTTLEITIASANAIKGSNILVFYSHGIGVGQGTSSNQIAYRLQRTAPSASTVHKAEYIGNQGATTPLPRLSVNGHGIDDRSASGDYVYKVEVTAYGESTGNSVYRNWYAGSVNTITALVLK